MTTGDFEQDVGGLVVVYRPSRRIRRTSLAWNAPEMTSYSDEHVITGQWSIKLTDLLKCATGTVAREGFFRLLGCDSSWKKGNIRDACAMRRDLTQTMVDANRPHSSNMRHSAIVLSLSIIGMRTIFSITPTGSKNPSFSFYFEKGQISRTCRPTHCYDQNTQAAEIWLILEKGFFKKMKEFTL